MDKLTSFVRTLSRYWVIAPVLLASSVTIQAQPAVSIEQVWQYGRGIISEFEWNDDDLLISTYTSGNWQVNFAEGEAPIATPFVDKLPISISPDGTRSLMWEADEILVYDTLADQVITRIPHIQIVSSQVVWHLNSRFFTNTTYNEQNPPESQYLLEMWNADTGELETTLDFGEPISAWGWHPDGQLIAVRLLYGAISIENVMTGEQVQVLSAETANAATIAWSPDGSILATSSGGDFPVKLWRADNYEPVMRPNQPTLVRSLAWSADGTRLAGALVESGVGVWNVETDELVTYGVEPDGLPDSIVDRIIWRGDLLAAYDFTERLRIWNTADVELVWDSTNADFGSELRSFAVNANGSEVALAYNNSPMVELVNTRTGVLIQTLELPVYEVTQLAWNEAGDQLAVTANSSMFLLTFMEDGTVATSQIQDALAFDWSPDDILAISSADLYPERADMDGLRYVDSRTLEIIETRRGRPTGQVDWSPNGRYIADYRYNTTFGETLTPQVHFIDIWEWNSEFNTTLTLQFPAELDAQLSYPEFVWRPDSSGLVGYSNGALWDWRVGMRDIRILTPPPSQDVSNAGFPISINADGDLLAVSNMLTDNHAQILDAYTGEFIAEVPMDYANILQWGADDMLYVYDGILHAYQVSRFS